MMMTLAVMAEESRIPAWVMTGIMYVETQSYIRKGTTDDIVYVDRRRGSSGERGPYQITLDAFNDVKHSGEYFFQVEIDTKFATEITLRYLRWIDKNYSHGDWNKAVRYYNAGKNWRCMQASSYLSRVIRASWRQ